MKKLVFMLIPFTLAACQWLPNKEQKLTEASSPPNTLTSQAQETEQPERRSTKNYFGLEDELLSVESQSSRAARKVLSEGRRMALAEQKIIRGSCWDYVNTVFRRAGYANKLETVFDSPKYRGRYAKASQIKPGDWLYYINHSYNGIEHSAIFIDWVDKKHALMLSYAGEGRRKPARYLTYDLSHVYKIVRAVD